MAKYNTEQLKKDSLEAIIKNQLVFFDEICAFLTCSKRTMYDHGLHKMQELKDALDNNRLQLKQSMRKKWYKSDNATLQISAYKLLANQEELDRLTVAKNQNENKDVDKFKIIESDEDSSNED